MNTIVPQKERYLAAGWPAPLTVRAWVTTRQVGSGVGVPQPFNLGRYTEEEPARVQARHQFLADQWQWQHPPCWLNQMHGNRVVTAHEVNTTYATTGAQIAPTADAVWTDQPGWPCAVLTADCLPVLFCHEMGYEVAAAHAGWRGLAAGVLHNTVAAFNCVPEEVWAWLGPAIGPARFEVGPEVREAFLANLPKAAEAFKPGSEAGRWRADIYSLARQCLAQVGVTQVYGGHYCTFDDADLFFSHRREDQQAGRMASMIWIDDGQ